jgi:hypothetical protein
MVSLVNVSVRHDHISRKANRVDTKTEQAPLELVGPNRSKKSVLYRFLHHSLQGNNDLDRARAALEGTHRLAKDRSDFRIHRFHGIARGRGGRKQVSRMDGPIGCVHLTGYPARNGDQGSPGIARFLGAERYYGCCGDNPRLLLVQREAS